MPASAKEVWSDCLCRVAEAIPSRAYKNWFDPLRPTGLEESDEGFILHLEAPSRLAIEMVRDRHRDLLRRVLSDQLGPGAHFRFNVQKQADVLSTSDESPPLQAIRAGRVPRPPAPNKGMAPASTANRAAGGPAPTPQSSQRPGTAIAHPASSTASATGRTQNTVPLSSPKQRLRTEYTFDHFVEGDCNSLARNASLAIAREPAATSYNPFLVYGGVGLGKTHLVQAIGNYVHRHEPDRLVVYVSSEEFTSQFVRSIQKNCIAQFTAFYREVDVLVVDDVQFFSGKEKTQEEFFHIFNALHQNGKQIVLCADRPPAKINGIEERLLSRFQWGLSADVQQPDLETRIAILQRKAELHGVDVPSDVLQYVAHHVRKSIRSLEGALKRLKAHHTMHGTALDLSVAKPLLHDLVDDHRVQLDTSDIMESVADFYNLDVDALVARTRKRPIVAARQVAMYFARRMTEKSLSSIGLSFGGRDHSTVLHAINTVEDRLDTEPAFKKEIQKLKHNLSLQSRVP